MTKALRSDPVALHNVLVARHHDLQRAIMQARRKNLDDRVEQLSASKTKIEAALKKVIAKLEVMAKKEQFQVQPPPSERVVINDVAADEEPLNAAEGEPDDAVEVGDADDKTEDKGAELEDPQAPSTESEESEEEENPVAMPARLRKEMGDLAADFLDEYGLALHQKVKAFFENLSSNALNLGQEGEEAGLREELRAEIGYRGLAQLEPHFEEWRSAFIKHMSKDIQEMFKPEEEVLAEGQAEAEAEMAAEEAKPDDQKPEEKPVEAAAALPKDGTSATIKADVIIVPSRGTVSAVVTDFRPSGVVQPKME